MAKPYFRQVPNFEYVDRTTEYSSITDSVPVKNLFKRGKLREDIFGNLSFFEKYQIQGDDRPDNVAYKVYGDETLDWVVLLSNNILNIQTEWPLPLSVFDEVLLSKYGSYQNLYSGIHHYETLEIRDSRGTVVLPSGLKIPNTWKSNGNFIEVNNSKITQIFSGDGRVPSKTVTVTLNNGIKGLNVGSEVTINNISEKIYNGRFEVTTAYVPFDDIAVSFTYELTDTPVSALPILSTNNSEEVIFAVNTGGNSYYYEFYDPGLNYYTLLPSSAILKSVSNFEYESELENNKRNIFVLKPSYLNVMFNDLEDIMPYKKGSTQYVSDTLKKAHNIKLYD